MSRLGRHAAQAQRRTASRTAVAAAALVLVVGGGGFVAGRAGAFEGLGGGQAAAGGGRGADCADKPAFVVDAAPEVAEIVRAAAVRAAAGGACADYTVRSTSSSIGPSQVAGSSAPDAWIPDSTTWLDRLPATTSAAWTSLGSITHTPVVLVTSPAAAPTAGKAAASWASLINGSTPLIMANPDNDSASRLAYDASRAGRIGPLNLEVGGRLILLSRLTKPTAADLLAGYATAPAKAAPFPAPEQEVAAFTAKHPGTQVGTIVPAAGTMSLDYPWFAPVAQDAAHRQAGSALRAELRSTESTQAFTTAGFRRPDDTGGPIIGGTAAPAFTPVALISADLRRDAVEQWDVLSTDMRMLAVLDVSGSMLTPSPTKGLTRWDVLQGAATKALGLMPDGSKVGGWVFSTARGGPTQDWKPLAPIAPLDAKDGPITHRQNLVNLVAAAGKNVAGDTGLYDTTLAAFRSVSTSWEPNYVNSVVVMTDGINDDTTGGISLPTLLAALKKEFHQDKPVRIITIGMGEADPKALKQIAATTGGTSYIANTPSDIERVLVQALLARPLPVR